MVAQTQMPAIMNPRNYIEKVSLTTGEVLEDEIHPKQLLVGYHRDNHVVDVSAQVLMSQLVDATGNEELTRQLMKQVRKVGHTAAEVVSDVLGVQDPEKISKLLFGLKDKDYYFRYKKPQLSRGEVKARLWGLQNEAREGLDAVTRDGKLQVRVLLTGGTGFVGKEIIAQAVRDDKVAEIIVLIRPKTIRDRKTKEILEIISPAQRGEDLLDQLWITEPEDRAKVRFIAGDIEKAGLGIASKEMDQLRATVTHVIHCAASVAFDDPYEESFRANVLGTVNALEFSYELQTTSNSPFVAHVGIETAYIHGRQTSDMAREDEVTFPRNFYNNYYELTKAMGSLETERFMLQKELRVIQLCPSIVIGDSQTGNNRGDMKVINAPVNAFGRAHQALSNPTGSAQERSLGWAVAKIACVFPGDASALINLVPVDRVVEGIVASLFTHDAVGERVHLVTDNHITSEQMRDICVEELGVRVMLSEPTLHRNVTLPILTTVLTGLNQERLASALEKLGTIFGGYSEWGQPMHVVENDSTVLGLSEDRPITEHAFRMLCRHNRYVQDFGKVRDLDEVSRREKVWAQFITEVEQRIGKSVGALSAAEFGLELNAAIDTERMVRRTPTSPVSKKAKPRRGFFASLAA